MRRRLQKREALTIQLNLQTIQRDQLRRLAMLEPDQDFGEAILAADKKLELLSHSPFDCPDLSLVTDEMNSLKRSTRKHKRSQQSLQIWATTRSSARWNMSWRGSGESTIVTRCVTLFSRKPGADRFLSCRKVQGVDDRFTIGAGETAQRAGPPRVRSCKMTA